MTKKEYLINKIFNEYKQLKEANPNRKYNSDSVVRTFIKDRLCLHGPKGYMFHASVFYKRTLYETRHDDVYIISEYVFNNNAFRK